MEWHRGGKNKSLLNPTHVVQRRAKLLPPLLPSVYMKFKSQHTHLLLEGRRVLTSRRGTRAPRGAGSVLHLGRVMCTHMVNPFSWSLDLKTQLAQFPFSPETVNERKPALEARALSQHYRLVGRNGTDRGSRTLERKVHSLALFHIHSLPAQEPPSNSEGPPNPLGQ